MADLNNNKEIEQTKEVIVQSKHLVENRTKKNGPPKTIPANTTTTKRTKAFERPPQGKRKLMYNLFKQIMMYSILLNVKNLKKYNALYNATIGYATSPL